MTKTDTSGPDGCLCTTVGDSAGLVEATSPVFTIIEPAWQSVCDKISRADFWALFGKLAIESADPTHTISINYQYGRKDQSTCSVGCGRLPSAQGGMPVIQQVFVKQMGLAITDAVTLIGAHTLGHVHTTMSGYGLSNATTNNINAWDATPTFFDNQFYSSLINKTWNFNQPNGPSKSLYSFPIPGPIMLGTDMALGFPVNTTQVVNGFVVGKPGQICGPNIPNHGYGCSVQGSRTFATTKPSTFTQVAKYATNNAAFLTDFAVSYAKMASAGYGVPANTDGSTASGKLGTLTAINLATC